MLKTKKMLSLILAMGMIFTLAACGGQKTNDSSPDNNTKTSDDGAIIDEVDGYDIADATYVLKAGHVLAEDHPYNKALLYMDEYLCKATNGDLRIEVYPNAQLGNERDLQEGCWTSVSAQPLHCLTLPVTLLCLICLICLPARKKPELFCTQTGRSRNWLSWRVWI